MKRSMVSASLVVGLFAMSSSALFVNGGFETGDFTGWSVSGDASIVSSFTPQFNTNANWAPINSAFYDSKMLLLGSPNVGNEWDAANQSFAMSTDGVVTQADIDNGLHLYFKWGSLLEEPTNNVFHDDATQPAFSANLEVFQGGAWSSIYSVAHIANQLGFTNVGTNMSGNEGTLWYGSDLADIDLSSALGFGDQVRLSLSVKDCGLGGHGGLVFLDGFGTTQPQSVPEPSNFAMLASALLGFVGLGFARRRRH